MAQQSSERRKFIRVADHHVVDLGVFSFKDLPATEKHEVKTITKNLSLGGILFESETVFDVGTLLKLSLKLPGWDKFLHEFYKGDVPSVARPLVAIGRVVRVEEVREGMYEIGVSFCALDEDHKRAVKKYIEQCHHA